MKTPDPVLFNGMCLGIAGLLFMAFVAIRIVARRNHYRNNRPTNDI